MVQHTTTSPLTIAAGPWLRPIPGLRRTDPEHRYWLGEHLFAVSVTGVVGSAKSDWAMARIEATRHLWEPRGHTVHLALEALLHSRFHPLSRHRRQAGELDASFSHNGCSFCWSAGRTSYAYPEPLQQQEQALKEAQRLAVATGAATEKHGKAFWTIKPGRS